MKAVQIKKFGGPEVLRVVELPSPTLGSDQIRIRVRAAGVNFADLMMRMGLYPEAPKPPFVPGYEVAGEVTETGPEAKTFKVGDRVLAATHFAGYATEAVVPEASALPTPATLTDTQAASIPVNFMTAWVALHEMARVRIGDRVLVHSAAGGTGLAAVQIAAQAGATVVGLIGGATLSASKIDAAKEAGAKEVWTVSEWRDRVASRLPFEDRFQIVLDSAGGDQLKKSLSSLAPSGRVVSFGLASGVGPRKRSLLKIASLLAQSPVLTPLQLMNKNRGIFGLNMLKLMERPERLRPLFQRVLDGFSDGRFKVKVGRTFPLEEAAAAHAHMQARQNIGKIVLTVD